jgi:hypothetical protein
LYESSIKRAPLSADLSSSRPATGRIDARPCSIASRPAPAACAVCHQRLDPPGFALENFDAVGRWLVITRAAAQAHRFVELLEKRKEEDVLQMPVIDVEEEE